MAEIVKYASYATGRLFNHSNRKENDGVEHENRNIDNERTHLNYYLKEGGAEELKKRLNEVPHLNKKSIIVMCEFMIALPPDIREEHPEDERKFFESIYSFMKKDYGEENIIDVVIHKDEITPHMHGYFVPVVKNADGRERLCAKELINRQYLRTLHQRLIKHTEKDLGYPCAILTGATAGGNRTILELKNATLAKEIEAQQKKLENLNKDVNFLVGQIEKSGFDKKYFSSAEIFVSIDHLSKENAELKKVISQNGIKIPKEIIRDSMEVRKIMKDDHFRMVTKEDIDKDDILVIETYRTKKRIPPLWKRIEQDDELAEVINSNPQELTFFKNYLIFPTDNMEDTVRNLLKMKENEEMYRNVYFPSVTNDTYDLSETLLRQCTFNTTYQLSRNDNRQKEYTKTIE